MLRFKKYLVESYILPGFVPQTDPYYESNPTTSPYIYGPPAVPGLPGGNPSVGQIYYNPATGYTYIFTEDGQWVIISGPSKPETPIRVPPPSPEINPGTIPGRDSGTGTGQGGGNGRGGGRENGQGQGQGQGQGEGQGKGPRGPQVRPSRWQHNPGGPGRIP